MKGYVLQAIFALVVIAQVLLFGIPEASTTSQATGLDAVFQPITDVLWGFVIYVIRAAVVTAIAAFFVRRL